MGIKEFLNTGANIQLVVSALDLKEFSISLIEETLSQSKNVEPNETYLTRKETAEMLHVDLSTLFRYAKVNYLIPIKRGGRVFYRLSDIEKIMEG